jgi:hypothetical protein
MFEQLKETIKWRAARFDLFASQLNYNYCPQSAWQVIKATAVVAKKAILFKLIVFLVKLDK